MRDEEGEGDEGNDVALGTYAYDDDDDDDAVTIMITIHHYHHHPPTYLHPSKYVRTVPTSPLS